MPHKDTIFFVKAIPGHSESCLLPTQEIVVGYSFIAS